MQRRRPASIALDGDTGKEIWRYGAVPAPPAPAVADVEGAVAVEVRLRQMPRLRLQQGQDGARGQGEPARGGGAVPPAPGGAQAAGRHQQRQELEVALRWRSAVISRCGLLARRCDTSRPHPRDGGTATARTHAKHTGNRIRPSGKRASSDTGVNWGGVPLVYKNIVVVGAANGEVTQGDSPGDTRAFDARTGDKIWNFVSVAQPGDPNHAAAWLDDGWKKRQGVNHWGWYFTVDEQRDIVYTTLGSPAGNYWGGDRPGTNLYANSVVAIDANTGKYLWHFQSVHHDLWDSDQPAAPTLIDIRQNGRTIPALGIDQQDRLDVHSRSNHRTTDFRCRRATGSKRRRTRRMVFADAAISC